MLSKFLLDVLSRVGGVCHVNHMAKLSTHDSSSVSVALQESA